MEGKRQPRLASESWVSKVEPIYLPQPQMLTASDLFQHLQRTLRNAMGCRLLLLDCWVSPCQASHHLHQLKKTTSLYLNKSIPTDVCQPGHSHMDVEFILNFNSLHLFLINSSKLTDCALDLSDTINYFRFEIGLLNSLTNHCDASETKHRK